MAPIHVGIDLGSTGLRAAYGEPDGPGSFVELGADEWPWLQCLPAVADGPVPVRFASLKGRLGTDGDAGAVLLADAFGALRERIARDTSARIARTAIAVPARFTSRQRSALLELTNGVDLGPVDLVTDSVAAAIGHLGAEGLGTCLVYGMGYEGFELGLVRGVRGRYRVLGYEAGNTAGGSTLDEALIVAWLQVMDHYGSLSDETGSGDEFWLQLRRIAEKVKEQLVRTSAPVVFPMFALAGNRQLRLTVQLEPQSFEPLTKCVVARTLDRADALFKQVELARQDVETVLLLGGSTRIPQLRRLVSGLGQAIVPTAREHLARGALAHARRLSGRLPVAEEEQAGPETNVRVEQALEPPLLGATVLTAPDLGQPDDPRRPASELARARELLDAGRADEAEAVVRRVQAAAAEILDEIGASRARPAIGARPEPSPGSELLTMARKRLAHGQAEEAIQLAHLAWQREPDGLDIFHAMIDVHCSAATANPTVATFGRDDRWLRCALAHDPSNARVRGLLADRNHLHAKELHRTGKLSEALHAVEQALAWNPEHHDAEGLRQRLGRQR
ncbi:Hsp70 family protein [Actinomycetospora chibensis]|uniref:Hsp70 family protein n=1 Tax=Actinomycetospora chibensis TaxID=663606 RepID=A0ABV9RIQ8_9PSEU|nr:Hsp70 family protein [Actinomycetospora chibensis]MDD7927616.1 Hsp70 family protein [Actinomycetospora chibensis]